VIRQAEVKVAMGRHAEQIAALEGIVELVERTADPPRRAAWHYWIGFLHSFQGDRPELSIARCQEAASIAAAAGLDDIRAFADCCLAHVYLVAGDLHGALRAGEAALATFEARGNVWWTCRSLWALSPAANALGQWERSLAYCERALALGRAADDLRLKVVGWWRTGAAHVFRGDPDTGLRCLDEAGALSPTPFDAATIASIRGYARLKRGEAEAGMRELQEAWEWFDRSQLRYTRSLVTLRLAEGHLVCGEPARARALLIELQEVCERFGYRYLEGVVHRLLGEAWLEEDPTAAAGHLDTAVAILGAIGARNELAKAFRAQAAGRRRAGEPVVASALLRRALETFEALGTADEIPRVRALLAAL
jgi:tetratricopeptide (TPR) repeat protein